MLCWNADMKFLCMKQTFSSGPSVIPSFSHGACVSHKIISLKNKNKIKFDFKRENYKPLNIHKLRIYTQV